MDPACGSPCDQPRPDDRSQPRGGRTTTIAANRRVCTDGSICDSGAEPVIDRYLLGVSKRDKEKCESRIAGVGGRGCSAGLLSGAGQPRRRAGLPARRLALGEFSGEDLAKAVQVVQKRAGQLAGQGVPDGVPRAVGGSSPHRHGAQLSYPGVSEQIRQRGKELGPAPGTALPGSGEESVGGARRSQGRFVNRRDLVPGRLRSRCHFRPGTASAPAGRARGRRPRPAAGASVRYRRS